MKWTFFYIKHVLCSQSVYEKVKSFLTILSVYILTYEHSEKRKKKQFLGIRQFPRKAPFRKFRNIAVQRLVLTDCKS